MATFPATMSILFIRLPIISSRRLLIRTLQRDGRRSDLEWLIFFLFILNALIWNLKDMSNMF
jgi:hypothetical protein